MLKIITGKPGSGKSYYAVKQITSRCEYDPISESYTLNDGILLVCTLEGLRVNYIDFEQAIKEYGNNEELQHKKYPNQSEDEYKLIKGLNYFFNVETWQKDIAPHYKKILIVIDEAQRYFPASARDIPNSVWYWFEYHRHFGADIVLMTQHPSSLHRRVLNIAENYIEAAPPGLRQIKNMLRYSLRDTTTNEIISQSSERTNKQIFKAYKSATHSEGIKPPQNFLTKFYYIGALAIILSVGGGVFMYDYLMDIIFKDKPKMGAIVKTDEQPLTSTSTTASWNKINPSDSPADTQTSQQLPNFKPEIEGQPETAPAYRHLLQVQSVPVLAGCIKSQNACKCYTEQATPYPATWEQCLEHVANLKFNPYIAPPSNVATAPLQENQPKQTIGQSSQPETNYEF